MTYARLSSLSLLLLPFTPLGAQDLSGVWNGIAHEILLPNYWDTQSITEYHFVQAALAADTGAFAGTITNLLPGGEAQSVANTYDVGSGAAAGYLFDEFGGKAWVNTDHNVLLEVERLSDEEEGIEVAVQRLILRAPEAPTAAEMAGNWRGVGLVLPYQEASSSPVGNPPFGMGETPALGRPHLQTISAVIGGAGTLNYTLETSTDPTDQPGTQVGLAWQLDAGGQFSVEPAWPDVLGWTNTTYDVLLLCELTTVDAETTRIDQHILLRQSTSLMMDDLVGSWAWGELDIWAGKNPIVAYADADTSRYVLDLRADGRFTRHLLNMTSEAGYTAEGGWSISDGTLHLLLDGETEAQDVVVNATHTFGISATYENLSDGAQVDLAGMIRLADANLPASFTYFAGSEPGDAATGLMWNPWYGHYWNEYYPWIYHWAHRWQYAHGEGGTRMWLWDNRIGWIYTGADIYPLIWINDFDNRQGWFQFTNLENDGHTRKFWDHTAQDWFTVDF